MASVSLRLGDYRRTLLAAFDLVEHPVALMTVTGPGWDELENDGGAIRQWNASSAWRWARFDRWAKGRMRREGFRVRPLARIAQRQQRGVDHLHIVLSADTLEDRLGIQRYVELLKERHLEYGFGFIDDPYRRRKNPKNGHMRNMVFESCSIAGRYLCTYLGGSQLEAMVSAGDHSFRPLWIAPALTQASGVNVTRLRKVRHAYHVVAALQQGSRPRLPSWWSSLGERMSVLRLLRDGAAYAYF